MKLVTTGLIGLLVASPLLAQEPVLGTPVADESAREETQETETRERQHVVKKGDTLWDLAGTYLSNPFRWRIIYEANTQVVEDPHWIYPEEVLVIPGLVESVQAAPSPEPQAVAAVRPMDRPTRTVFYREDLVVEEAPEPTVLSEPVLAAVPVKPGEFTAAEFLADPDGLERYGRMIKPKREMTQLSGVTPTAHPKDEVYLTRDVEVAPQVGQRLMLVAVGRRIEGAGERQRVISPRAVIQILEVTPEVIRGQVESQFGLVGEDQLLVPLPRYPDFLAEAAEPVDGGSDLRGRLLEFVYDQPLHGRADRAFLGLGSGDGVAVGDVFVAYLPERGARERRGPLMLAYDPGETLPPEAVAELRVVRVTPTSATVTVDNLLLPRLEDGMWVQRVRKMP